MIPKLLVAGVTLYGLIQIIKYYAMRIQSGYMDSAGFLELNSRISIQHPFNSHYFSSVGGLFLLLETPADQICSVLTRKFPLSIFGAHPYFISVLTSIPRQLFDLSPSSWAATVLLLSFGVGFVSIIRFILRQTHSIFATGVFLLVLLSFPVITGSYLGQPYFDRLMFGPAVILMLGIYTDRFVKPQSLSILIIAVILLAAISERGALLAGLIGCVYTPLLSPQGIIRRGNARALFIAGVISIIYFLVWDKYWQNYSAYANLSISNIPTRLNSLMQSPQLNNLLTFVLVLSPFLILLIFSGRTLIIGFFAIAPNILVSVGGAELTGFYTHYHQIYLPILVAGAAIGWCNIHRKIRLIDPGGIRILLNICSCMLLASCTFLTWQSLSESNKIDNFVPSAMKVWIPSVTSDSQILKTNTTNLASLAYFIDGLNPYTVSTPEGFAPALYEHGIKPIDYWPMGVGVADVVIAPYINGEPQVWPYGDMHGTGPQLSKCVKILLERDYNVVRVIDVPGGEVKVFKLRD